MPDFLNGVIEPPSVGGVQVLIRLIIAMLLGGVVTRSTGSPAPADEIAPSFTVTLVLLSILIAMVTQVIGDNVARAFSLVGALSIVRFRTVVRDTQDTAYVIFAVAVGMAVGAGHPVLAISGIGVVAVAAFADAPRRGGAAGPPAAFVLKVRLGLGHDANAVLGRDFDDLSGRAPPDLDRNDQAGAGARAVLQRGAPERRAGRGVVKALNRLDGVQGISLERVGFARRNPRLRRRTQAFDVPQSVAGPPRLAWTSTRLPARAGGGRAARSRPRARPRDAALERRRARAWRTSGPGLGGRGGA